VSRDPADSGCPRPRTGQIVVLRVWPRARRLCLECRKRLPGQERTGTPANDVEDYPVVVD